MKITKMVKIPRHHLTSQLLDEILILKDYLNTVEKQIQHLERIERISEPTCCCSRNCESQESDDLDMVESCGLIDEFGLIDASSLVDTISDVLTHNGVLVPEDSVSDVEELEVVNVYHIEPGDIVATDFE